MVSDTPMKRSLTVLLAIPLLLGSALAQSPAPSPPPRRSRTRPAS